MGRFSQGMVMGKIAIKSQMEMGMEKITAL
jgi:hypothetical protein